LAKEKLKWQPVIELEEGLVKTVEYFEKILARGK
jgi:UDP-glucuronate decarboxylase